MIIVKIIGGLGNQMFQYAYSKNLEQKGYKVKIDISSFETYKLHGYQLDYYDIDLQISTKEENDKFYKNNIFFKILKKIGFNFSKSIGEKSLLFDHRLLEIEDNNYVDGYFQSENYFKNIRETLINQFIIKQEILNYTNEIKDKIVNSKNSCSLHIRRGDFINSTNISIHGSCNLNYYKNAIKFLEGKEDNIDYFIFSDDINWCKENLEMKGIVFIESEVKRLPHEDIYLMSLCKHNIIANSTFSWWGAWLNQNQNKIVITPKKWFADNELERQSKDIVCESWVKI